MQAIYLYGRVQEFCLGAEADRLSSRLDNKLAIH